MEKKTGEMERMAAEIVSGMKEWREQNPKATFREIERETMKRMAALPAQLMAEVAQSSSAVGWDEGGGETQEETAGKWRGRSRVGTGICERSSLRSRDFSPWMRS